MRQRVRLVRACKRDKEASGRLKLINCDAHAQRYASRAPSGQPRAQRLLESRDRWSASGSCAKGRAVAPKSWQRSRMKFWTRWTWSNRLGKVSSACERAAAVQPSSASDSSESGNEESGSFGMYQNDVFEADPVGLRICSRAFREAAAEAIADLNARRAQQARKSRGCSIGRTID